MAIEAVTRTVGYRLRCGRCGRTSPVCDTEGAAAAWGRQAGWQLGSLYDGGEGQDWCPDCVGRREAELAKTQPPPTVPLREPEAFDMGSLEEGDADE